MHQVCITTCLASYAMVFVDFRSWSCCWSVVTNKAGWTPLHRAAFNGRDGACRMLMRRGAGLHAITGDGCTPLHLAAKNNHLGVMHQLTSEFGARADFRNARNQTPQVGAATRLVACTRCLLPCCVAACKDVRRVCRLASRHANGRQGADVDLLYECRTAVSQTVPGSCWLRSQHSRSAANPQRPALFRQQQPPGR